MGNVCTFFGHHDCSESVKQKLREVLIDLIANHSVDTFYVGNKGSFDWYVRSVLRELTYTYKYVHYAVVLERLPEKQNANRSEYYSDTIFPEDIEDAPPRFALVRRNNWMLQQASYVVTYITHPWGGAAQFAEIAKRQGKFVINLPDQYPICSSSFR